MKRFSVGSLVLILLFFAMIGYILFSYFTTPLFNPIAIFIVIIPFVVIFINSFGEFTGFIIKQKNFISRCGAIGVARNVEHHSGGMSTYTVTTWKRYVRNKDIIAKESATGGFASFFSATTTIEVTDKSYKFREVPEDIKDTPEGAVFYDGSINHDVYIVDEMTHLRMELEYAHSTISKTSTILEKSKSISAASAQESNLDLMDATQKASTVLLDFIKATREKPPKPKYDEGE